MNTICVRRIGNQTDGPIQLRRMTFSFLPLGKYLFYTYVSIPVLIPFKISLVRIHNCYKIEAYPQNP